MISFTDEVTPNIHQVFTLRLCTFGVCLLLNQQKKNQAIQTAKKSEHKTMIGCFVALVCNCIIGSTWYSSKLPIGRLWMRRYYPGKTELEIGKEARIAFGMSVIAGASMILLLRFILIDSLHTTSLLDGLKFSVGLSCLTTLLEMPHVLFSKRYLDIFLLDQLYNLVVMFASGLCITYFG